MMTTLESFKKSGRARRGVALIGVIGLLLVLLVFAGGMVAQLSMEVNSVKTEAYSNRALSVADAGVHDMAEQIQQSIAKNLPPPASVSYSYPEPAASPSACCASYVATIDAKWPSNNLMYYLITSTGTFDNGFHLYQRKVRAIARTNPTSNFASWSIYEVNQFGQPVWYRSDQYFNGPVYSGGPMRIAYAGGATPAPPIFGVSVTTANNPVWSPGTPGPGNQWNSVVSGGQPGFSINKNGLSMPQPSRNIAVASEAWQGDTANTFPSGFPGPLAPSPLPTAAGVYIDGQDAATSTSPTMTTGMFIGLNGKTTTIDASVSGNTQTFMIYGPWKGAYKVQINYVNFSGGDCSGSTTVTHGANSHTFAGTPCGAPGPGVSNPGNGAIFADGTIVFGKNSPDVTLEGDYAFATPDYKAWPMGQNDIWLNGNLAYDPKTAAVDKASLWANNVIVNTSANNVVVDAAIIAGYPGETWSSGNFRNFHCSATNCGGTDQGTLTINGSLVENARGAVGEWVGGTHTGFSRVINFDGRFATAPPPFNPTTGTLNIIAWEDLGQ